MRAFVSVFALFVVAFAKPQYNYESGPIAVPQIPFNPVAVNTPQFTTQQVSTGLFNQPQVSTGLFNQPQVSTGILNQPQVSTGIFNQPQVSTGIFNQPQVSTGIFNQPQVSTGILNQPQISTGPISQPQISTGPISQQQISTGPISTPQFTTPQIGGVYHEEPVQQIHEAPLITKQFYLHSAPEDHEAIHRTKHFVLGRPQKNYRVVFIKSPSDTNANVHLSAEYAPQEEKTVIYVLSQKDTALDIDNIATPAPTQPSKPEVFFIKYKTPEEAAHAQREIQNQYNVLGGTTSVEDGGHAPVTSVVGALNRPVDNHALNTLGNEYLPAHKA